ncbi:hypothetical protein EJB05_25000, partial [Eragrostis curvula]
MYQILSIQCKVYESTYCVPLPCDGVIAWHIFANLVAEDYNLAIQLRCATLCYSGYEMGMTQPIACFQYGYLGLRLGQDPLYEFLKEAKDSRKL